jgi:hypothetical protein
VLRQLQTKKKLRNRQNRTRLQLRKLLLQLIRCAKSRRKLNVLYRQLNVVVLQLRRSSSTPSMFKPEKSSRRLKKQLKL